MKTIFKEELIREVENPAYHEAIIVIFLPTARTKAGVKTKKAHPVSQDELDIMR